jgi:recombination protein RecA
MAEKKKAAAPAAAVATDKKKALETALAQIEKNYGKGAIMRLGDDIAVNVEAIPTGSLSLDLALGIGGVPRGRIVEIYGPESCGKTTLALHIVASAQVSSISEPMSVSIIRGNFFIIFKGIPATKPCALQRGRRRAI